MGGKVVDQTTPYSAELAIPNVGMCIQVILLGIMNYYWIVALGQIFYKNIKGKAVIKIIFGNSSKASYINSYDPKLLKVAASISAVK
jgi:hypothetical protein